MSSTVRYRYLKSIPRCLVLRRRISSLQKKLARNEKRQKNELKQQKQLEETEVKKTIKTNLSDVPYGLKVTPGSKKDVSCPLPPTYSSNFVETCWYDWWEKEGFFKPMKRENAEVFSMVIPPPNVTGKLHLGHALTVTLEDVLCRWNRMRGKEVVWVPGCDHAGIATQAVVEKLLATKNLSRQELGREKFLEEVWKWKDEKEEEIYNQLRVLGASLDWTRTNFTLSPKFSHAVREAFIRLHGQDLIVRKKRLINWSCALRSTISDIEIDNHPISGPTKISVPGYNKSVEFGVLHTFAYPLLNPTADRDTISVSTTRIETMLGDTAIAVHPDDSRYSSFIGSQVRHPILKDVTLPIIGDAHVDKDFGTGAVKITPAHDFHDFEIGSRHNLPMIDILNDEGNISCPESEQFTNLPRFVAREKVLAVLDDMGLLKDKQSHAMDLPICSRSGDVVEPRIKTQWFVKTKELAAQALRAVETGQIQIEPDSHLAAWRNWLTSNEDWCISRQLWWGHRIPAYHVSPKQGDPIWISAHSREDALEKAEAVLEEPSESLNISQDEDVLDTWFSSALFPFASFGWPENTDDYKRYYPLSVMETGYDLIFFWVARMAMLGIALTGKVPFNVVFLHSMVRDSQGRKMSKSLGNVIDPIEVINGCSGEELDAKIKSSLLSPKEEKYALQYRSKMLPQGIPECGTDALRFYLCFHKKSGRDLSLDVYGVMQYRYFCNKIWNVFKFLLMNVRKRDAEMSVLNADDLRPVDHWIRSRLSAVVEVCNSSLETLNFSTAATNIHKFFFTEFADFYLESCKSVFTSEYNLENPARLAVEENFEFVCETFFRLLAPFMPNISEELWQRLPNRDGQCKSVTMSDYPIVETHDFRDICLEQDIETVRNTIQTIRNIKLMFKVPKTLRPDVIISCMDKADIDALSQNMDVVEDLTKIGKVNILSQEGIEGITQSVSYSVPDKSIKIFMKLKSHINVESQFDELSKQTKKYREIINSTNLKLTECKKEETRQKLSQKLERNEKKLLEIETMLLNLEQLR